MDHPIRVTGLRKTYGTRAAVDGLDLEIRSGEVFALLGPNGAGKTTTVEVLEGFRRRDGGTVEVLGEDPQGAGLAWRNRIGIVLQSSTGLDLITSREALASTAKVYRRPRGVDEVLDAVGLTDKADDRVGKLSGGQRRRLDVGLGIVGSPELLFLDEPTTGFDPQARRDFWELIRGLAGGGTTILLTTHYLDEAEHLADRVGVIAGGRMLAIDSPANIGGRAASEATVTWEDPSGQRHTERTPAPTALVARLASAHGGEVPGLTVTRPSLEDTYLSLIAPHLAGTAVGADTALAPTAAGGAAAHPAGAAPGAAPDLEVAR
ncbi:ABC transporter ATP-binding protein [Phycicoccus ginsengisoli]